MISDRHRDILLAIVDAYVLRCRPVSSSCARETGGFNLSTATIRNRMAELESGGYIRKAHVSSGRIPTDRGYRVYVDSLAGAGRRAIAENVSRRCRRALRAQKHDIAAIMLQASRLLAEASRNVGLVYGTIEQASHVESVRLVRLDDSRVLVVVSLSPAHEHTEVLHIDCALAPGVVDVAEGRINALVGARTLGDAREALDVSLRDNLTDEGVITREVAAHRDSIFSEPPSLELYYEERGRLLDQPELADPKNLQSILHLLHNKARLTAILSHRSREGTEVTIGTEHEDEVLRSFSLVTAGYRMGGARGVLGIMGPTRMRYELVLPLVEAFSRELRMIGEEFFPGRGA